MAFFFLPNLDYQETRGHSDNCLNAREVRLPIHTSACLLFKLHKCKFDTSLLNLKYWVQSISGLTN